MSTPSDKIRHTMTQLPFPFGEIPPPGERLDTVRFVDIMTSLLDQCQGLAMVCYRASMSPDVIRPLVPTLYTLSEFLDLARDVFLRWKEDGPEEDRTHG
jgi:hypothetical protein